MGANQSNTNQSNTNQQGPQQSIHFQYKCSRDSDCMTIDENLSTPGNIIYSCPEAKCVGSTCQCTNCVKDPYLGKCCQGLQTINGTQYCVQHTGIPATQQANSNNNNNWYNGMGSGWNDSGSWGQFGFGSSNSSNWNIS